MFAAGFSGSIVWTLKIRARARGGKESLCRTRPVVRKGKFNCDRLLWGLAAPRARSTKVTTPGCSYWKRCEIIYEHVR
jgi:hypothetical protein